jgi:DNA polymerase-3 subunit epsilon
MRFLAIDFETSNSHRDSACAVGLVVVENGEISREASYLIRPPTDWFAFTWLHGISWEDVKGEPTFKELWGEIEPLFRNIDFAVAHNASFDRSVLKACCEQAGISAPDVDFKCTMLLSRKIWKIYPTKLPDVCARFGIELRHHQALSDTRACARIMIHALRHLESTGQKDSPLLKAAAGRNKQRLSASTDRRKRHGS